MWFSFCSISLEWLLAWLWPTLLFHATTPSPNKGNHLMLAGQHVWIHHSYFFNACLFFYHLFDFIIIFHWYDFEWTMTIYVDLFVYFSKRNRIVSSIETGNDVAHDSIVLLKKWKKHEISCCSGLILGTLPPVHTVSHTHTFLFDWLKKRVWLKWIVVDKYWWCHVKLDIRSDKLVAPLPDEIKDGQWLGVTVRSQGPGRKVLVSLSILIYSVFLSPLAS